MRNFSWSVIIQLLIPYICWALYSLVLFLEWPFVKKITGRSWVGSLAPLVVMNLIGLPTGAAVVIGPWIMIFVLAIVGLIPGYVYLFFAYVVLPLALLAAIAGGELVTAKMFFWSTIRGDLKDYITLCMSQVIKLSFALLAVLLGTGSIG